MKFWLLFANLLAGSAAHAGSCDPFLNLNSEAVSEAFFKQLPQLNQNPNYVRPNHWFLPGHAGFVSRNSIKQSNGEESSGFLLLEFGTYTRGGIETAYRSARDSKLIPLETQVKKIELDMSIEAEDRPPGQNWKLMPYGGVLLNEGEVKPGDVIALMHESTSPENPGVVFMRFVVVQVQSNLMGDPAEGDWAQHGNVHWTVSVYNLERAKADAKQRGLRAAHDYFDLIDLEFEKLSPLMLRDLRRAKDL